MAMIKKHNIAHILILWILLSPISYKLFNLPLIIIIFPFIIIAPFIFMRNSFKLRYGALLHKYIMLLFIFNSLLIISILIGLNYPIIYTGVYSDPIIPEYYKFNQIILGIIYNNLLFVFILMFQFLLQSKNYIKSLNILDRATKIIYYFAFFNVIINFIEIGFPLLHKKLMLIAGYTHLNYYFLPRPVSIALNSYVNAFLCAYFSFWSFYFFDKEINKWKRLKYFVLFIVGIISVFISGARYAIILLIFSIFTYNILQKKLKKFFIVFFMIIPISVILMILLHRNYLELILSIIKLSDSAGSADVHKELFISSIKIFLENPWGIGIGKTDFGAQNAIPELTYNPESYLLSLLLGGGLFSFIVYLIMHFILLRSILRNKIFHVFSFNLSVLIVSLINIQVLQSVVITTIIAVLYSYAFLSRKKDK